MIVRICRQKNCRVRLSHYNPADRCWEHRRAPRRISEELNGLHVQRDDEWLRNLDRTVEVETWRPYMMSDRFIAGLERRELSEADREAYETGSWLLPPEEEATIL